MDLSNNIKFIRESKKIKQVTIANALDLDPSYYFRLEKRGEKLTIEQLQGIANALGVGIGALLGLSDLSENGQTLREEFEVLKTKYDIVTETLSREREGLSNLQNQVTEILAKYRLQLAQKYEIGYHLYNEIEGDDLVKIPLKGFKVSDNAILEQLCYDGKYERLFSTDETGISRLNELLFEDIEYRQHVINFIQLGLIREIDVKEAYLKFRSSSKTV